MSATLAGRARGQRLGYARVSSAGQRLDRQVEALGDVDRLFSDAVSGGSRSQRAGLAAMLDYARAGDTVVVWSMDRLARSLRDLLDLVDELTGAGVTVVFLREGQTYRPDAEADPTSRLLLGMLGAVAQFERSLVRERQAAGIAAARARGAYRGRRPALTAAQLDGARARVAAGVPKAVIARDLGVHRSTLHRALARQRGRATSEGTVAS